MVPRLPTSLLKVPGSGFALAAAGSLVGMLNENASKNREGDGCLALDGCCWVVRHNNQAIVGRRDRRDDGEDARPGWSVLKGCFSYFRNQLGYPAHI
jgi:hypothetical protein